MSRLLAVTFLLPLAVHAQQSQWAHLAPNGHLTYAASPRGDRIADFSYAGYMGGGVSLPHAPLAQLITPSPGDDTDRLQAALDHIGAEAQRRHTTLALVLAEGTFHLSRTLTLSSSNVVLRGTGPGKTILALTGTPHLGLRIAPAGTGDTGDSEAPAADAPTAPPAASTTLEPGKYVPSGTLTIPVVSAQGFAVGDTILIHRTITPGYLAFMGMDKLTRSGRDEHWIGPRIVTERRIAAITANTLTLDVPLTDNYDPRFEAETPTRILKVPAPHRIEQVGVEALTITCPSLKINLDDPHFDGIQMTGTQDAWLRNVRLEDTTNSVRIEATARRITITGVDITQRIPIQSSAKPFGFSLAGTQTLVMNSTVHADKLFFAATQAREQGPNVLLDCNFQGDTALEPHQRWGTGVLIDNVTVKGGAINLINRGIMGTGHGWTMGWGVVWNSSADSLTIQSPPGSTNWSIGSSGQRVGRPMPVQGKDKGPNLPEGIVESPGKPVQPQSLYRQQLADRLGPAAVANLVR